MAVNRIMHRCAIEKLLLLTHSLNVKCLSKAMRLNCLLMFLCAADVDECATANDSKVCDLNEYCVNIIGSFKCASVYCRLGLLNVAVTCPSTMVNCAFTHHHRHFRILSADTCHLIYMSKQYKPRCNVKYTKHRTDGS